MSQCMCVVSAALSLKFFSGLTFSAELYKYTASANVSNSVKHKNKTQHVQHGKRGNIEVLGSFHSYLKESLTINDK